MHPSTTQFCGTTDLATVQSAPSKTRESSRNRFRSELSDLANRAWKENRKSSLIVATNTMRRALSGVYTPICLACQSHRSKRIIATSLPSSTTNFATRGFTLRIEKTLKQSTISSSFGRLTPKTNQATKSHFYKPTKAANTKAS